jgi:hypothetical protein
VLCPGTVSSPWRVRGAMVPEVGNEVKIIRDDANTLGSSLSEENVPGLAE